MSSALLPGPHGSLTNVQKPRSRIKMLLLVSAFLGLSLIAYMFLFSSCSEIMHRDVADGFLHDENHEAPSYDSVAHPSLAEMIQVQDLPAKLLPGTGKHRHASRLVVVGDVHGMKSELIKLLEKIGFNNKHDHLILAGDMVSKGPDSAGVVDLAIKLGATGIRGNHEDRVILTYTNMEKERAENELSGSREETGKTADLLDDLSLRHRHYKDGPLIEELGKKRIEWLKSCPVILRVGQISDMGQVVVAHAGLVPGVELQRQDPSMVMNMRTIGKENVPSEEHEGRPWAKVWNKYQKSLPKTQRTTVIYGHDSKRGLQTKKYSMGIDTGCVKGGKLTALVIDGGSFKYTHRLVNVNCKDRRGK